MLCHFNAHASYYEVCIINLCYIIRYAITVRRRRIVTILAHGERYQSFLEIWTSTRTRLSVIVLSYCITQIYIIYFVTLCVRHWNCVSRYIRISVCTYKKKTRYIFFYISEAYSFKLIIPKYTRFHICGHFVKGVADLIVFEQISAWPISQRHVSFYTSSADATLSYTRFFISAVYATEVVRAKIAENPSASLLLDVPIAAFNSVVDVEVQDKAAVRFLTANNVVVADLLVAQDQHLARQTSAACAWTVPFGLRFRLYLSRVVRERVTG